ncbi:DEDD exonuclease domain-containing protein [Haloglycomyces albus]|uniref:DEDD exonuclease domain-containing protein n=1 Tax=Haloglycomyces albus TaxID=526067 RepID=UPI00046D6A0B|nr:DEDD exonuclease domain-containing protein [Haloglycomyces albus]
MSRGEPGLRQPTLEEMGVPLQTVTFCVVDLETTGLAADAAGITEIGAVKVRGGEVIGEFSTLVNPGEPIDPRVVRLTGINDDMVADAPKLDSALPAFLEFAGGATLVAHNAGFDIGFLRHACERLELPWPRPPVVDTVHLARKLTDKQETPNRRLKSLARLFGSPTTPNHRALDDARATVAVLHGLIERASGQGVHTDIDLIEFCRAVPSHLQRRKKYLAEDLPHRPGVYIFRDSDDRALYIGVSGNIAKRVRSYFTRGEQRRRMRDMLALAERVEAIVCAHRLEAAVTEFTMIAQGKPPFNRASKYPEHRSWVRLTKETYPRLTVSRKPPDVDEPRLGPTTGTQAQLAVHALEQSLAIRECKHRLSPSKPIQPCFLGEIGQCPQPCDGSIAPEEYRSIVHATGTAMSVGSRDVDRALANKMEHLARQERFEAATERREELYAFQRLSVETQRLREFVRAGQIVVAAPAVAGGWEVAVIRHGFLAGATTTSPGINPMPEIDACVAYANPIETVHDVHDAAHAGQAKLLLNWLLNDGTRIVSTTGEWACEWAPAGN